MVLTKYYEKSEMQLIGYERLSGYLTKEQWIEYVLEETRKDLENGK